MLFVIHRKLFGSSAFRPQVEVRKKPYKYWKHFLKIDMLTQYFIENIFFFIFFHLYFYAKSYLKEQDDSSEYTYVHSRRCSLERVNMGTHVRKFQSEEQAISASIGWKVPKRSRSNFHFISVASTKSISIQREVETRFQGVFVWRAICTQSRE